MSIEKAAAHLEKFGLKDRIKEFDVSSATVELAAKALNTDGARIAKSLSFLVDGEAILVVAAGDTKVDNHKFKEMFHTKAKMIPFDDVEALIGHAVGGVCPFGINDGVRVYLDESLRRFDTVFPAVGSANSAIELTINELEECSNYLSWVDVCKIIE